jgi:hypothetical protein
MMNVVVWVKESRVHVSEGDLFQRPPPPQIVCLRLIFYFSLQHEELRTSRPRYLARAVPDLIATSTSPRTPVPPERARAALPPPPEILVCVMELLAADRTEAIKAPATIDGKPNEKRRGLV